MKKPVAFLMACLALAASLSCAFATQVDGLHTIWDIPWGTSIEDFCTLAQEKTGIVFSYNPENLNRSIYSCRANAREQDISILGYQVTGGINASFSRPDGFGRCNIIFLSCASIPFQDGVQQLEGLYQQLQTQHGSPSIAFLEIYHIETEITSRYSIPVRNGNVDFSRLLGIFLAERHDSTACFYFNNILLSLHCKSFPEQPDVEECSLTLTLNTPLLDIFMENVDFSTVYPSYDDRFATPSPSPTPTPLPAVDVGV